MTLKAPLPFIFLILCMTSYASPARKGRIMLEQPDGSCFTAMIRGDEFANIKATEDGRAVIQDEDGWWCYAIYGSDGSKRSSGWKVGEDAPGAVLASSRAIPYQAISAAARAKRASVHVTDAEPPLKRLLADSHITRSDGEKTTKHGLVILAQFRDVSFTFTKSHFERLLNEEGYNLNEATGCAKEYFDAQFDGKMDFVFNVSDIVTLTRNRAYFGGNGSDGNDKAPAEMIEEACKMAADSGVDFSLYDDDGDGTVDNVFVFFAGEDEAEGASEDCIWSHAWYISSGAGISLTLDGKKIDRYACTAELTRIYTESMVTRRLTGIGTFCHEYCHTFGLPDLYDTDYEEDGGWAAGLWGSTSLMDSGNQNNRGNTPPYLNVLERQLLGLDEPIIMDTPGKHRMKPVQMGGPCYRLDTAVDGEYFLFECRDNTGWDTYIGGNGMLAYHIDRSKGVLDRWTASNTVNSDASHQHADLIEADSRKDSFADTQEYMTLGSNLTGIFFPYGDINSLTSESIPGLKSWNGESCTYSLAGIRRTESGEIEFTVVNKEDWKNPPSPINPTKEVFADAAILLFESSYVCNDAATVSWGLVGDEPETILTDPYSPGRYAVILENLEPSRTYTAKVKFSLDGMEGESLTISFATKRMPAVGWPYIYLASVKRNEDGSFPEGTRIPLRVYNATEAAEISWLYNGRTITHDGDGYYTLPGDGTLKAVIDWEDGSKDVVEKEITIR